MTSIFTHKISHYIPMTFPWYPSFPGHRCLRDVLAGSCRVGFGLRSALGVERKEFPTRNDASEQRKTMETHILTKNIMES